MDQGLLRLGHVDQRVAAARRLAEPRADQQQQIGIAHPVAERRGDRDADMAGVVRMRCCRNSPGAGTTRRPADRRLSANAWMSAQALASQPPPPRITNGRCAAASSARRRAMSAGRVRPGPAGSARHRAQAAGSISMSSGSASTTGPGRPEVAVWKARLTTPGCAPDRRSRHPLGDAAEHLPVVDLLERLAPAHRARDLADQQDHRRRILARDVHAVASRWWRPARASPSRCRAGR